MDTALSDQNGINAGIAEMAKLTFRPSSEEAGQNVSQNHGPGPGQKKPRLPRLFHKKSKTGCRGCRSRRVKCDETRPICNRCRKHRISCFYDRPEGVTVAKNEAIIDKNASSANKPLLPKAKAAYQSGNLTVEGLGKPSFLDTLNSDPLSQSASQDEEPIQKSKILLNIESRSRRLLELRLMHHFSTNTYEFYPGIHDPLLGNTWRFIVPRLALDHTALLNAVFANSSLHLSKLESDPPLVAPNLPAIGESANFDYKAAHREYLHRALQDHRNDVANLGSHNADAICMTSSILRLTAICNLQDRPINPYEPPVEWLQMACASGIVYRTVFTWVKENMSGNETRYARLTPIAPSSALFFQASNREGLTHLLERRPDDGDGPDPWDEETQKTYESAVSFIGIFQMALKANEDTMRICWLMMAFTILVPKQFSDFVEERRPRALVILAHYFASIYRARELWWVGETGRREVLGLLTCVPLGWRELMKWPVDTVGG